MTTYFLEGHLAVKDLEMALDGFAIRRSMFTFRRESLGVVELRGWGRTEGVTAGGRKG